MNYAQKKKAIKQIDPLIVLTSVYNIFENRLLRYIVSVSFLTETPEGAKFNFLIECKVKGL